MYTKEIEALMLYRNTMATIFSKKSRKSTDNFSLLSIIQLGITPLSKLLFRYLHPKKLVTTLSALYIFIYGET